MCIDEVSDYGKMAVDVAREKGLDRIVNKILKERERRLNVNRGQIGVEEFFKNITLT